jgi:aminoglycoside phosphotransferase (APT) family kinase protein
MSALDHSANTGTAPLRDELRFDEDRLCAWLSARVPNFSGPIAVAQFKGGQSNPTLSISTPTQQLVLRRKPPGELLASAHAVDREARVQAALHGVGFPVARVHGYCDDASVVGSPFYVMDHVEGRIFWDASFGAVARADRPAYFDAMVGTLAALHRIDPARVGLADYGKPGHYVARQIARWARQYEADTLAGRDPGMDRLVAELPKRVPADDGSAVVHGDFRCDNLIFHPSEPRVLAVLDWELSTLGHPLADFAYHALMYRVPPSIVAGLAGADLGALGIPGEEAYAEAYCRATGRSHIPGYTFYVAFNLFRLAAIFHGIKGRVLRGTASSAHARERAASFPLLVALANAALDECS